MESRGGWLDLVLSKGTRRATIIVMTLSAMQRLSGINVMLQYMSTTLPYNGGGIGPNECMIIFALLLLSTGLVGMFLVDWLGRKPTIIASAVICSIIQGIMGIYFYLEDVPSYIHYIPYVCMFIFPVFYQIGLGKLTNFYSH